MTWAIYAMRGPGGVRRLEDMPQAYRPPPLGPAARVVTLIREAVPDVDATDPTWLRITGPDYSVEATIGKGVEVRDVTFYLGGGERAIPVVLQVCRHLRVTPYDTESGEMLTESSRPPSPPPLDEDEMAGGGGKRRWWSLRRS